MAQKITEADLREIVSALIGKASSNRGSPGSLVRMIHRRKFPGTYFFILEPLLHNDFTCKYAIDLLGNLKQPPACTSDAIEAAWNRSWSRGIPQTCDFVFPALLKIGGNDNRLLSMIERSVNVDCYGIHRVCAETLMQIQGGRKILSEWSLTVRGQCECHLHKKLAAKITHFLTNGSEENKP